MSLPFIRFIHSEHTDLPHLAPILQDDSVWRFRVSLKPAVLFELLGALDCYADHSYLFQRVTNNLLNRLVEPVVCMEQMMQIMAARDFVTLP